MSLRDEAITHMAQAMESEDCEVGPADFCPACGSDAERFLDALLDFLDAHTVPMMRVSALAQEWVVCDPEDADAFVIDVAALRGTTE